MTGEKEQFHPEDDMPTVRITIAGRRFELDPEEVREKLKKVRPRKIRVYYVEVDGRKYPIRQVAEVATGLPSAAISTPEAFRLVQKLGFPVKVKELEVVVKIRDWDIDTVRAIKKMLEDLLANLEAFTKFEWEVIEK